jgi:proteic killer suppression protein
VSAIRRVEITRQAWKQLRKVPDHIKVNLRIIRAAQRSIRLSRSYRAIYEIRQDVIEFVSIEEIGKHDY